MLGICYFEKDGYGGSGSCPSCGIAPACSGCLGVLPFRSQRWGLWWPWGHVPSEPLVPGGEGCPCPSCPPMLLLEQLS